MTFQHKRSSDIPSSMAYDTYFGIPTPLLEDYDAPFNDVEHEDFERSDSRLPDGNPAPLTGIFEWVQRVSYEYPRLPKGMSKYRGYGKLQ